MSEQNEQEITANQKEQRAIERAAPEAVSSEGIVFQTTADLFRFASAVVASGLAPSSFNGDAKSVMLAIQTGLELGMKPMQALSSMYVVNNRVTLFGDAMLGLVIDSGELEGFEEGFRGEFDSPGFTAFCKVVRRNPRIVKVGEFSRQEAVDAGLTNKGPWRQYFRRMLTMRARSFALRDAFPDVLKGIRCREEVEDFAPFEASGAVVAEHRSRNDELDARLGITARTQETQEEHEPQEPQEAQSSREFVESLLIEED